MIVRDIMTTNLIEVRPQTPVKGTAGSIVRHQVSGIPVVTDDGTLAGMVSEPDLRFIGVVARDVLIRAVAGGDRK